MKHLRLLFVGMLALGAPIRSVATTLLFDEFGTSPTLDVNGMHVLGVTLGFGPGQALYNGNIGTAGNSVLLMDPVLTGPTTGTLTLNFDFPTSLLQFDIALQSVSTIDNSNSGLNGGPAYTVSLSNGTVLNEGAAPQPNGNFSEGAFQYSGPAINSAPIAFFHGIDAGGGSVDSFGLDNLTFNSPEPGSTLLLPGGLLGLGLIGRRRAGTR